MLCKPSVHQHGSVQVKEIDLSKESPCGHGVVTCFSIYGGDARGQVCNFAAGREVPGQDQLWVDTMLDNNQVSHCSHCLFTPGSRDDYQGFLDTLGSLRIAMDRKR